jgi:acyl-CoA synthetase (AMP-forming)/AMP-acid ligase II
MASTLMDGILERFFTSEREACVTDGKTGQTLSYGDMRAAVLSACGLLHDSGVGPGDSVALLADNSTELMALLLASLFRGAIASPLSPTAALPETERALSALRPKLILVQPGLALPSGGARAVPIDAFAGAKPQPASSLRAISPDAGAFMFFTPGTVGPAKPVLLRHRNIASTVTTAKQWFNYGPGHTSLVLLPMSHPLGLTSDVLPLLLAGGRVVVSEAFHPARMLPIQQSIEQFGVNSFTGFPRVFELFLRFGLRLGPKVKFCIYSGGLLPERVRGQFREKYGVPLIPAYGLTEATWFCAIAPLGVHRAESVGMPVNAEVRIVLPDGSAAGPSVRGEIWVRGDGISVASLAASQKARPRESDLGWLPTGDVGYLDEDGYLYVTGRKEGLVARNGREMQVEELSGRLSEVPGVAEGACVPQRDGKVVCFLVRRPGAQLDEGTVRQYFEERLRFVQQPDAVSFIDALPRTPSGNVQWSRLLSPPAGA